jgi:D-alanyl-D-alanine dipeptidase
MQTLENQILLSDPRVADIPTIDNEEKLISLRQYNPELPSCSPKPSIAGSDSPTFWLRRGAHERLVYAQNKLPGGFHFLVKETFRSISLQTTYFNRGLLAARKRYPDASELEIIAVTSKFTAPPQVAGHPTGGAIDLTLANADGQELDMGCLYDENETMSEGRCFSDAQDISEQAKRHRTMMFDALLGAGFVNYPYEWWHWSYGDKYWALVTDAPCAIYDVVDASDSTARIDGF